MDITYLGEASFLIKGDRVVAINPGRDAPRADVALHSSRQKDRRLIVNGPGEYEIGGVLIVTVGTGPTGTLSHAVEIGGLNVVHLGGEAMSDREIAAFGEVDILILAARDLASAQRIVAVLEPRVVLPYGPGSEELSAALGVRDVQPESRFSWNGSGTPPKVVLLKPAGHKKRAA